jgi:hypothetical protein
MVGVATSAAKDVGSSNTDVGTVYDGGVDNATVNDHITASGVTNAGVTTGAPGSGYTEVAATAGDFSDASAGASFHSEYRTDGVPGTYAPTGTFGLSGTWVGVSVAYKDSTGPTPTPATVPDVSRHPKYILAGRRTV